MTSRSRSLWPAEYCTGISGGPPPCSVCIVSGRLRGRLGQRRRLRIITAQEGRCADCGFPGGRALEAHHDRPLSRTRRPDRETPDADLVALCRTCHRKRHPSSADPAWDALVAELV